MLKTATSVLMMMATTEAQKCGKRDKFDCDAPKVKVDDPCRCDCPDACPDETYTQDQSTCECIAPAKEEEEESGYKAKFTYHENGADWEDLNENLCQTGREQSPIDFGEVQVSDVLKIDLKDYENFKTGEMVDLGKTLQFDTLAENTEARMTLTKADGEVSEWQPFQFHFHAPSEHTVGGRLMDLEIHFVHLPPGGLGEDDPFNAAVLGVFFDREAGGNEPNKFIESLKFNEDSESWEVEDVNVRNFLWGLDRKSFMSYDGSLTTPPCTEGVRWSVLLQAQSISEAQLKAFTRRHAGDPNFAGGKGSNRITMPLNDRKVYYTGFTAEASGAASLGAAALALVTLLNF